MSPSAPGPARPATMTGFSRRSLLSLSALVAAGAPVLSACGDSDPGTGPSSSATPAGAGATAAPTQVATPAGAPPPIEWQLVDAFMMGHHVNVEVGPLMVVDDRTTALPVRVTRLASDTATDQSGWDATSGWDAPDPLPSRRTGIRLVDPYTMRVWTAVGMYHESSGTYLEPGESATVCAFFGSVDVDRITAYVPMVGFPEVAVAAKDEALSVVGYDLDLDEAVDEVDLRSYDASKESGEPTLAEMSAPAQLETFTHSPDVTSTTRTTDDAVVTTLASDVTFETGQYTLTPEADSLLESVAKQIDSYPAGGGLEIVGHTDDVLDEASNQTLSEQRADAVTTRIGELTDLSAWTVTTSGKGESEPAVDGTDEAARAANRRVVVTITPTNGTGSSDAASAGVELPLSEGPTATGAVGVTVEDESEYKNGSLQIKADSVVRRGGLLMGRLSLTGSTDYSELSKWTQDPNSTGIENSRNEDGDASSYYGANGIALMTSDLVHLPLDYIPGGRNFHRSLADLDLSYLEYGTTNVCVVWPDIGQDTVVIDHGARRKEKEDDFPWRLTDVAVSSD